MQNSRTCSFSGSFHPNYGPWAHRKHTIVAGTTSERAWSPALVSLPIHTTFSLYLLPQ